MKKKKIIDFLNYYFSSIGVKNIIERYDIEHDIDIKIYDIVKRSEDNRPMIFVDSEPIHLEHSIQDEDGNNVNFSEAVWDELYTGLSLLGLNLYKMVFLFNKRSLNPGLPFDQDEISENVKIRTFSENVDPNELKWHTDKEDRIVIPENNTDWMLQMDNDLPQPLIKGKEYHIPKDVYHRVIKGEGDLNVKVIFK